MNVSDSTPEGAVSGTARRLRVAGTLLTIGFVGQLIVTVALHPGGEEDNHTKIFTDYADSDPWVAVHILQFLGGLLVIAGLIALYPLIRERGAGLLAGFATAAAVATAATLAVLQGLDGVALKQATEAWVAASPQDEAARFADAETIRWLEWGFQSYFRLMFGLSFVLFGAALLVVRLGPTWLGWAGIVAGLLSIAYGIDVGYSGLESDFQGVAAIALILSVLVFALGTLLTGRRVDRTPAPA